MKYCVGVDGCRAGWLSVQLFENGEIKTALFDTFGAVWNAYHKASRILVDMPIGLPDVAARVCDLEARAMLKTRRSSVFVTPVRAAVYATTYADASEHNYAVTGKRISRQVWNISHRIREVDGLLHTEPAAQGVIAESHPELVFFKLAGHEMQHRKKLPAGHAERLAIIRQHSAQADEIIQSSMKKFKRSQCATDDVIDALVLAVCASFPALMSIPPQPPVDANGLPMRVLLPL